MRSIVWVCVVAGVGATAPRDASAQIKAAETEKTISVTHHAKPVLTYHKAAVSPPEGADPAYARSGFIHPIHAPAGGVVTGIHPKDHLHHLGLWHAWVKTRHKGRKIDFWNLKKKTGAVRFAKTEKIHNDKKEAGFTVRQEHVALTKGKDPQVILSEKFTIRVRHEEGDHLIDHTTVQTNVTDTPLELPAYRYGGPLAYRSPHHWNKDNSDYLTSGGKTRKDGHATRGRWCAMWGPTDRGIATLAVLCHPKNRDAPQRMRIWPPDVHHGTIFFNYVPVQARAWELKPDEPAVMRYRIVVSDGKPDVEKLNRLWNNFAGK